MRAALVLLVACGTDGPPHEVVTCSPDWQASAHPFVVGTCERACEKPPAVFNACFDYGGESGRCQIDNGDPSTTADDVMRFVACT